MSFPFKKILCPIDFDQSADTVLAMAANLATTHDATVYVLHVVPMIIAPTGVPVYVEVYKQQEESASARLRELAHKHLSGVKYQLIVHLGAPVGTIIRAVRQIPADVILMATHGRRGFAHIFLGSVAEAVLREADCPVLTVRSGPVDRHVAGYWMTSSPLTASPEDRLATIQKRMTEGKFRSMPILKDGRLVGIITDRDIRQKSGNLDTVTADAVMTREVLTVTPKTSVWDAARLLAERKIGAMPVLDQHGAVVGVVTTTDLLRAFTAMQND